MMKWLSVFAVMLMTLGSMFAMIDVHAATPATINATDGNMAEWPSDSNMGTRAGATFYFTFNDNALYFGWDGSDWASTTMGADLFIYLNTTDGGSSTTTDWSGKHNLPFLADYAFCLENSNYYVLRKWNQATSTWDDYITKPGLTYIGWSGNMKTEIQLNRSDLGNPTSLSMLAFAQWQDAANVWTSFPMTNPADNQFPVSFSSYYQYDSLSAGVVPNDSSHIVTGQVIIKKDADALNLAIIWHMHQPFYKNFLEENTYSLPWVRNHGAQSYIDHAKILQQHPGMRVTINMVPALIYQLEDYGNNNITDRHTAWAWDRTLATNLTSMDRAWAQFEYFWCADWVFNYSCPASEEYYRLYNITKHSLKPETMGTDTPLSTQDFIDLTALWYLFQVSPWYVQGKYNASERDDTFLALYQKTDFTYADVDYILAKQQSIIKTVNAEYNKCQDMGLAEITTTPWSHPIMPLLMSPGWQFGSYAVQKEPWREDVDAHLQKAIDIYQQYYGERPVGLWPSEEAMSSATLGPVFDAGFDWFVTDANVLKASRLADGTYPDPSDPLDLYQPYLVRNETDPDMDLTAVFRDRVIADRIGFEYGNWRDDARAVADFISYIKDKQTAIKNAGKNPADYIITVALDGENWMFYGTHFVDSARPFLDLLYTKLEEASFINCTTVKDFLAKKPATIRIEKFAEKCKAGMGSWINDCGDGYGDVERWAGEEEEDLAWTRLIEARKTVVAMQNSATPPSQAQLDKAWECIYAAEGSDWFWWYGLDADSGFDEHWDNLFKEYLRAIYTSVNAPLPDYLAMMWRPPISPTTPNTAIMAPVIDGNAHTGEWTGAALYPGSTGTNELDIKDVSVGYTTSDITVKVTLNSDAATMLKDTQDTRELTLYFMEPNAISMDELGCNLRTRYSKWVLEFPSKYNVKLVQTNVLATGETKYTVRTPDGLGGWVYSSTSEVGTAGLGTIVEFKIPFQAIGMQPGFTTRMRVVTSEKVNDVWSDVAMAPQNGPIEITIPSDISPEIQILNITDEIGDETGNGNYNYPTSVQFAPGYGLWDITGLTISMTDFDVIFRVRFDRISSETSWNTWSMAGGYSHQIVQIYVDRDNVSNSGNLQMLQGANCQVTPDFAWEVAISATGDRGATFAQTMDGKMETNGIKSEGDFATRTIKITATKSVLGNDPTSYGYVIIVGSQDGYGVGRFRQVEVQNATWVAGGGEAKNPDGKYYHSNIFDMITPSSMGLQNPGGKTQAQLLHSYDVAGKKYAQVPGIRIPKEMIAQQVYGVRVTSIQPRFALVEWKTTKNATSIVEYGTTEACTGGTAQDSNKTQDHSVVIRNLEPNTKYFYRVKSVGDDNAEVASTVYNFTTINETQAIPVEVLMINMPDITNKSATIKWKTSTKATCTLEYCTDNKTFNQKIVIDTSPSLDHEIELTGLEANTKYYARISAEDIGGQVTKSGVFVIQTLPDEGDDGNDGNGNTTKPKTFIEQYGLYIAAGVGAAALLGAIAIFFVLRKKSKAAGGKASAGKSNEKLPSKPEKNGTNEVKDEKPGDKKEENKEDKKPEDAPKEAGEGAELDARIKKLEGDLAEAKSKGLDVDEAEGTLRMAKKFLASKNYVKTKSLIMEAEKELGLAKAKN